MTSPPDSAAFDDPEFEAILVDIQTAMERGEVPNRERLVADNPRFASRLQVFFADLDVFERFSRKRLTQSLEPTVTGSFEALPDRIIGGRYKLRENIGEGGMGSVWVAEQLEPVQRKVAIKLIKAGMDSRQILARFEAERQALALMDHPNIAKVLDGGLTEQGRPWFAMEYVKGVSITEYCDNARLPLSERLNLFLPVCQAVQHAHLKGIVHRDLKPSNILVCLYDDRPVPKVIDFGLAKALHQSLTDKSIYTGHGVMVGTPLYMSPEQAEYNNLDVDTRTDIYSLGVVLYELLTSLTPLERQQLQQAAYDEVLRLIRDVEPIRPSLRLSGSTSLPAVAALRRIDPRQLCRQLAGDLDWIVLRALEKERNRRYGTAADLARDIERFLGDEPVDACPPSTSYRARKFLRRHRRAALAGTGLLATLFAGLMGTGWGLVRARSAEQEAIASATAALRSKTQAIQALNDVTFERDSKERALKSEAAQRHLAEAAEQRLLQSFRESTQDILALWDQTDSEIGFREHAWLQWSLERWQMYAALLGQDERSLALRQEGHRWVGSILERLGQFDEATVELTTARDLMLQLVQRFPDNPSYVHALAHSHNLLGTLWRHEADRTAAARAEFTAAIQLLEPLVPRDPGDSDLRNELAASHENLADLLRESEDPSSARPHFEQAIALRLVLATLFPQDPQHQFRLARSHSGLARFLRGLQQLPAAREEYTVAIALLQNVITQLHEQFDSGNLHRWDEFPGSFLKNQSVDAAFEHEHDMQRRLLRLYYSRPQLLDELAQNRDELGMVFLDLEQFAAAEAEFQAALDLYRALLTEYPDLEWIRWNLDWSCCHLGDRFMDNGQHAEALVLYDEALSALQPLLHQPLTDSSRTACYDTFIRRADALQSLGRDADAVAGLEQLISTSPEQDRAELRVHLASILLRAGRIRDAVELAESLIAYGIAQSADEPFWKEFEEYTFACIFSVASREFPERQNAYAERAMTLLRQVIAAGWNTLENAAQMAGDADLDPLRDRADFRELVNSLPGPRSEDPPRQQE